MFKKDLNLAIFTLVAGLILILISPWLLTLPKQMGVSFENSGQIGDTIGGITAPIVGLIGAILLFLALKAQINANKIVMDQMREQRELDSYQKLSSHMTEQVQILRDDINEYNLTQTTTSGPRDARVVRTIQYKGVEAIIEALDGMKEAHQDHDVKLISIPHFAHVRMILERLSLLVEDINNRPLNEIDKNYLLSTARYTYDARLRPVLKFLEEHRESKQEPCKSCGRVHSGIPEEIYGSYDRLNEMLGYSTIKEATIA